MQFYAQNGQDKFVSKLFNGKKSGYFLDIGAFDGVYISNTLFFEKNLLWKGICIEPNPAVFEKLKDNRTCICLNCCVGSIKGTFKFLSVSGWGIMLSGLIDMFDQKHLDRIDQAIKEHGGSKEVLDIPALPLKDIFEKHSVRTIDYCNIDVEGGEMAVLNSIDFSKIQIKVFTIENNNGVKDIRKFLKPYGYKLISKLGVDEVYQLNSIRYDLMLEWRIRRTSNYFRLVWKNLINKIGATS